MNSFTVFAVGNLARDPETGMKGDRTYTRLCLIGNDYAGKDDQGETREAVTSLWLVAFDGIAESLARAAQKGDKLIVQAKIRADIWVDKDGDKKYDHSFVVQGYRLGSPGRAKREQFAAQREEEQQALEAEL